MMLASVRPAHAADPTTADCLAASDASLKAGNEHRLRAERSQLLICAAPSCPADIQKECLRRVDEVNAAIPTLVFEVKDAAGNDLSAVRVTMDGEVLAERIEGSALSIDPGEHTFVFEAAGQPPVRRQLVIREAEKERRESVRFGAATTAVTAPTPAPMTSQTERSGLPPQRVVAIAAAGVGLVGLGLGTAFGISALSKKSDAHDLCPDQCSSEAGVDAWRDARTAGNRSTLFFIVGGVGVAAAAALWFTAPVGNTSVGLGASSVQLRGTW